MVIEMLMTWFEALNHKWQKVTADGVSTAVRNERSATFFNVVNFTLVHWHYTLASSGEGVFFNTWSKEMADVAAVGGSRHEQVPIAAAVRRQSGRC